MKYTLRSLFEIIDEEKAPDEYYYECSEGGSGIDFYIDKITYFDICGKDSKLIIEANGSEKTIGIDENSEIDVDGFLIYYYTEHNMDFSILRAENIDEVQEYMYSCGGLANAFTGDIIVIENGRRKKYLVRDKSAKILTCSELTFGTDVQNFKENTTIEWVD